MDGYKFLKPAYKGMLVPDPISKTPLAEMYKYSTSLRSITQGRGIYRRKFSHYEEVPGEIAEKVIESAKKEKEDALKEREEIIAKSKLDSRKIIKEAEKTKQSIIAAANKDAEKIIAESRGVIAKEREKLKEEMNLQLIELVNSATHSALPNLLRQEAGKSLVEDIVLDSINQVSM